MFDLFFFVEDTKPRPARWTTKGEMEGREARMDACEGVEFHSVGLGAGAGVDGGGDCGVPRTMRAM